MNNTVSNEKKIHNIVASVNFPTSEIARKFMPYVRGYLRKSEKDVTLFQKAEAAARTAYENILKGKKHRVLIITGENIGRNDSSDGILTSFIREITEDNQRENYFLNIKEFETEDEKKAFVEGLTYDSCNYDNFTCREDERSIDDILKVWYE